MMTFQLHRLTNSKSGLPILVDLTSANARCQLRQG